MASLPPRRALALALALLPALAAPAARAAPSAAVVTITEAPAVPSAAPQFVTASLFTSAVLNGTNAFRAQHGAPRVGWNATLAAFAAGYLGGGGAGCDHLAHSGGPYGENLALGCADAAGCVELWGDERRAYDWADPGFSERTGHFTQLVWRDTAAVGCGRRLCGARGWYLACEYWPRGNVAGRYAEEVGRQVAGPGASAGRALRPPPPAAPGSVALAAVVLLLAGAGLPQV